MKTLNEIISEKLILNKNTKEKNSIFNKFCKTLYLDQNDKSKYDDIEKLYDLYKNDCNKIIEENFDGELISTNFELMFMVAAMLIEDQNIPTRILIMGTNIYKGKNNPYDYSWFEEEDSNGDTVLDVMGKLYSNNEKFKDMFSFIYIVIQKCCTNYKNSIEGIWKLQEI